MRDFVESRGFNAAVTAVIVINAVTLGVDSLQSAHMQDREEAEAAALLAHDERETLLREVIALRSEIRPMRNGSAQQ